MRAVNTESCTTRATRPGDDFRKASAWHLLPSCSSGWSMSAFSESRGHLAGSPLQAALKRTVDFEASATVELYLGLLNPGENSKLNNYFPLPLFGSVEADGAGFTLREDGVCARLRCPRDDARGAGAGQLFVHGPRGLTLTASIVYKGSFRAPGYSSLLPRIPSPVLRTSAFSGVSRPLVLVGASETGRLL